MIYVFDEATNLKIEIMYSTMYYRGSPDNTDFGELKIPGLSETM